MEKKKKSTPFVLNIITIEKEKTKLAETKKISDDLRTIRGSRSFDPIPLDLIPEIFKNLPVKTLARFLCISKQYASIIRSKDFKKSYLIKSSTRPHNLIFTFEDNIHQKRVFFSANQLQNQSYYMNCNTKPYTKPYRIIAPSIHGLICCGRPRQLVVYNPSTRRSVKLPKIDKITYRSDIYHCLGYDPINGEYKVLCMTKKTSVLGGRDLAQDLKVLTLGNGNYWRMVKDCPPPHSPESLDICINGVVYYEAFLDTDPSFLTNPQAVMSFDVSSERFDLIKLPEDVMVEKLISYEGKLAVMHYRPPGFSPTCRIDLWVLMDAVKHEWSNKVFELDLPTEYFFRVFCHTDAGEFVFAPVGLGAVPYYVIYYDHKNNILRRVYIEGITELREIFLLHHTISIFSGQLENLMFL